MLELNAGTSDRLSIHPIANLISTIIGAALAGLLGATLSAPVLAMTIRISRRIRAHREPETPDAHEAGPVASG